MDVETEIVKETRKLDSEMQTLVSENYNKFISATDTIRKVKIEFIIFCMKTSKSRLGFVFVYLRKDEKWL